MSTEQPEQPEQQERSTPSDDDFLAPPPAAANHPREAWWQTQRAQGVMLVFAGLILGGVVVSIVDNHSSASTPTAISNNQRNPFGGQEFQPGQGLPGGFGGLAGEQRLTGTLTALGKSSITVRTASGTATYSVTSATEIVRAGQPATLSYLRVGDSVFVHVYQSGSRMLVERIFDNG